MNPACSTIPPSGSMLSSCSSPSFSCLSSGYINILSRIILGSAIKTCILPLCRRQMRYTMPDLAVLSCYANCKRTNNDDDTRGHPCPAFLRHPVFSDALVFQFPAPSERKREKGDAGRIRGTALPGPSRDPAPDPQLSRPG